jgi:lysophospholipase L1-like esterase
MILVGCVDTVSHHDQPGSIALPVTQYHAYGDSITYGYNLSDPATQAYPVLVAAYEQVPFENYALSGDQACDMPTRQIFANEDNPVLATHTEYTVLIGTNDVDVKGTGAYESVFILCHKAALSWLAVPVDYKVLATDSGVTTTGAGQIDSTNHWNAWTTAGQGSSVSFPITITTSGPIYAWVRISDNNPATYTYSLDGVVLGTASTQTNPRISTQNGTNNSLGFLRLPPVITGKHVVTFTQTSTDINGVSVVGIGTPSGPTTNTLPTVLAGTIPYQFNDGQCTASSDEPCLEYIRDIDADVRQFSADGLDVRLFDTRMYMFGTAAEMNDTLHPNALGQIELSHAVEASW